MTVSSGYRSRAACAKADGRENHWLLCGFVVDDVHLNRFLRTPFGASQAASHESRTRTSSFVGSNSPLILLKMCSSASFRKSGGSGAPAACALYACVVPGAVRIRGGAVARMQWDLTTAAGEEKRRAPARIETWGCVHAEAKRWTSALEGAIVRWHTTVYVGFRLTGITNAKLRHSFTTLSA